MELKNNKIILFLLILGFLIINAPDANAFGFWWWRCDEVGDNCCGGNCNEGLVCQSGKCARSQPIQCRESDRTCNGDYVYIHYENCGYGENADYCEYGCDGGRCRELTPTECSPGDRDSQSCGNGGTQSRTCDSNGNWGSWGTCQGGSCTGECSSGSTRSCGNGGTQTCSSSCSWGTCNEPPSGDCTPGDRSNCKDGVNDYVCGSDRTWSSAGPGNCNGGGGRACGESCSSNSQCNSGECRNNACFCSDGGGGGGISCSSVASACRVSGNRFRLNAAGGGCGGGTACDSSGRISGSCSDCPCGTCSSGGCASNQGSSCGNCGTVDCSGNCVNQGSCSSGQTQCSGFTYQSCSSGCSWQAAGTDSDGDGVHLQCGDSQCDNAYAVRDATKTSTETSCADSLDNDCDGSRDCQDNDCAGQAGPGGVTCCQSASTCFQDDCVIENCVSNQCQNSNRNVCDSVECSSGRYCYNGDCTEPDTSEYVCMNCAPDTTTGTWDWPRKIFEDVGKAYSTNTDSFSRLFDSNEGACPGTTCTKTGGCGCYDSASTRTSVNRKRALATGNCCGDDPNEWYKRDYYGGECVSSVGDCIWSDGHAQKGNSGNRQWWCNPGNWYECNDNNIGQGSPNNPPPSGVCCAGTAGNNAWTPVPEVLTENQYSCTDGKDNDCDGKIDCEDNDCDGSIKGTVKNIDSQPVAQADITAKKILVNFKSAITGQDGTYTLPINCGTYNVVASHPDYGPGTKGNVIVQPNQQVTADFTMTLGSSCEDDCTFVSGDIAHASCDGRNGCSFYDDRAREACDLSQLGWVRDYDADNFIVCAEGTPQPKVEIEASVSCSGGTLVKVTRIVYYNGKPVKLVVAACG